MKLNVYSSTLNSLNDNGRAGFWILIYCSDEIARPRVIFHQHRIKTTKRKRNTANKTCHKLTIQSKLKVLTLCPRPVLQYYIVFLDKKYFCSYQNIFTYVGN